jgi:hypothetical protein
MTLSKVLIEELLHKAEVADDSREDLELSALEGSALDVILSELRSQRCDFTETPAVLSMFGQLLEDIEDQCLGDPGAKQLLADCRGAMIQLGIYKEVTEEELSRIIVLGGKKYAFVLGGKKYEFVEHL